MPNLDDLADIIQYNHPLAPYTHLKLGGPAEMLAVPRSREELAQLVQIGYENHIPVRVLGNGCNLLVRDEGIPGIVLRLVAPAFTEVSVRGKQVRAGTGACVSTLISRAAMHGLAGLEALVGIPGTVGGALRCNAGDRSGDIGQFVHSVEVLDNKGTLQIRDRDELRFGDHASNLDDPVLLAADFELEPDVEDAIVKRMRKAFILRKAARPLSFQSAARLFKDPRGLRAASLIDQAGLSKTRVGGAELSDRDANFVVVGPGASSRDVLRLLDLIRSQVQERFHIALEQEIVVW
jgi:UDP-N-acetylmuramate dehydrogenase